VIRVIGVGDRSRGDDAAGLEAARRLRARCGPGASVVESPADPPALLDAWRGAEQVYVVDAMSSGAPPGAVARFDAAAAPLPTGPFRRTSHGMGLTEAVELGRALGLLPEVLVVYGIEGMCWDTGAALTPAVDQGIALLLPRLAEEAGLAIDVQA
jgi:hydrogenase maturation protease